MRNQRRRQVCRHCGEPNTPDRPLSARGLHAECGLQLMEERLRRPTQRDPEWWQAWREGMARSAGLEIVDPNE